MKRREQAIDREMSGIGTVFPYREVDLEYKVSYEWLRSRMCVLAYVILCARGCFSWIGLDTFVLTVDLNLCLLLAVDYRRLDRTFLIIPFLMLLIPVNTAIIGTIDFIVLALLLRDVKVEKIAAVYFSVLMVFLLIWIFMYNMGMLDTRELYSEVKGSFSTYGFRNPNGLGMFSFHIYSCLFFLLRKRSLILTLILIVVINEAFYMMSRSRTPWFGGVIFIVAIIGYMAGIYKYRSRIIWASVPIFLAMLCYFLVLNYRNLFLLDVFLSGRLTIQGPIVAGMSPMGWLIGIKWPTDVPLDCSYVLLLFNGGLILVSILCYYAFRMMMRNFYYVRPFIPFILAVLACGCAENTFAECTGLSVIFWYFILNNQRSKTRKKVS